MVDDPRDALECFGSAPVDLLAIGPFVVRRPEVRRDEAAPLTTVVVPTVGRPSLRALLAALADRTDAGRRRRSSWSTTARGRRPRRADLRRAAASTTASTCGWCGPAAAGPARARNIGWRHAAHAVGHLPRRRRGARPRLVRRACSQDLAAAGAATSPAARAACGCRCPSRPRPTDWERGTAGLATARWITADMTYRRAALQPSAASTSGSRGPSARTPTWRCGSPRAQWPDRHGRPLDHPPGAAGRRLGQPAPAGRQRRRRPDAPLHGPDWREQAERARRPPPRHVATTARRRPPALAGLVAGRPAARGGRARRLAARDRRAGLGADRARPARRGRGPPDAADQRRDPAAATWHTLRGAVRHRRAAPWRGLPDLVLFDRDGTLVHDVPYNGDPARVRPVAGARQALDRLRAEGVRLAVGQQPVRRRPAA